MLPGSDKIEIQLTISTVQKHQFLNYNYNLELTGSVWRYHTNSMSASMLLSCDLHARREVSSSVHPTLTGTEMTADAHLFPQSSECERPVYILFKLEKKVKCNSGCVHVASI